jgi:deoxyribonucleoside regulator
MAGEESNHMAKPDDDDRSYDTPLLVKVAKSYYLEGETQAQIARGLGTSGSTISRYLTRAREEGIVRIAIVDPLGRQKDLEQNLGEKFHLEEAIVTRVSTGSFKPDEGRQMMSTVAAPFIDAMIKPGMLVGVGGSSTVAALASALRSLATPRDLTVCQVMGEYDAVQSPVRGAEITRQIAKMYNGTSYFLNAPALLEDPAAADVIFRTPGVSQMLDLYDRLNIIIVGVGPLHGSPLERNGLLGEEDISRLDKAGAVGDLCGHFFNTDGQLVDDAFPGRIIAMSWKQIQQCPMVIAVAAGDNKVAALCALLKAHLIRVLVTDERTAQFILNDLPGIY